MASKSSIAHMSDAPKIEISDGVAWIKGRSGGERTVETMSVRILQQYADRIGRALARYARGEQNVIVDD
jgi:hypothetical protein